MYQVKIVTKYSVIERAFVSRIEAMLYEMEMLDQLNDVITHNVIDLKAPQL